MRIIAYKMNFEFGVFILLRTLIKACLKKTILLLLLQGWIKFWLKMI